MELDDFVLLTLPKRIAWLHDVDGPRGKLSHDRFAAALGIPNRQTIISWEKNGREPSVAYAERLAEFSGFPAWVFRRREAEEAAAETIARRLRSLEAELDDLRSIVLQGFRLLDLELAPATDGGEPEVRRSQPRRARSGRRAR